MSAHLQYTLQRPQPSFGLSYPYPIPKTLLLPSASPSAKSSNGPTMPSTGSNRPVDGSTQAHSKPGYITRDYYSTALSHFSTSSASSSDSDSDAYDSSDEFCFDDIESRSSKSTLKWSRVSTSSSMSSPLLCTCDKQTPRRSSLQVGDFTFENQADYNDYNDLVRMQTRNAAKRRTSSSFQQSSFPREPSYRAQARSHRRQRNLYEPGGQHDRSFSTFDDELPQACSVPDFALSRQVSNNYVSSFEPALLAAKLDALLVVSPEYSPTFPPIESVPSLNLDSGEDDYETVEETDVQEANVLTKVRAHDLPPRPALDAESRFERALAFANWNKRGRAGVWEPPAGVSKTVQELVASIET